MIMVIDVLVFTFYKLNNIGVFNFRVFSSQVINSESWQETIKLMFFFNLLDALFIQILDTFTTMIF